MGDAPQIAAAFNLKYNIASALVNGNIRPENNTIEKMSAPLLQALSRKVETIGVEGQAGAVLEIHMSDGARYEASAPVASGDIFKKPQSTGEIFEKYYKNIEFGGGISQKNAERAAAFIMDIEHQENILPLIEIFA
jgi:hypothetical protein